MTVAGRASIGLLGKHPGYGDFLRAGLSDGVADGLTGWIDATLAELRDELGQDWGPFWDGAQELRFRVGRAVLGRTLAGVLRPSCDRVGRRYPLLLLTEGAEVAPPTASDASQDLWEALSAHLDGAEPGHGARALLRGLDLAIEAEPVGRAAEGPVVWAHRPDGDLGALLRAARPVEAERAELLRAQFWTPGNGPCAAQWLAGTGLPEARALAWMLAGVPCDRGDAGGQQ